jgi:hypothetical protein
MTAGQVPETLITGETADISRICQFGWYDWVMYHDPAKFPDDKMTLDQKLRPKATPVDFDEQDLTPEHIYYGEDADSIDSDHGELEVTPEIGDIYIGAETLIPRL